MKWVTRERPKIDRIACPWLIARFIDKAPEFLFVPSQDVLSSAEKTGAIPYDIPGVEMSHVGEYCSSDAFLNKYHLTDPGLAMLAVIVRGADTSRLDLAPEAAGLFAISLGVIAKLQERPRDAQAWGGHVRRPVRLVQILPEGAAWLAVQGSKSLTSAGATRRERMRYCFAMK